jgi:ABC-type multidrug transport system fused ATPase/permease subunit
MLASMGNWRSNLRIYWRIILLLKPHRLQTVFAVISLLLATGFSLIVPSLLAYVVDVGVQSGHVEQLLLASGAIIVTSSLRGFFAYEQGYLGQALSALVAYDLRDTVYSHLQTLSFSYHDQAETGQLMSRLTVDIEAVRNFIPMGLIRAAVGIVTFASVTIILMTMDWRLALVTMISIPLIGILAAQVMKRLRPLWVNVQNEVGSLGTIMQESLSGMRVVKSFAREEFETEKYEVKNQEVRDLNLGALRLSAWNQPLMILSLNLITVAVIWVGGAIVIGHHLSLGTLVAVITYVLLLASPVRTFGYVINWYMRALSSGIRVFGVLDEQPEIKDAPDAHVLENVKGHVQFEHVNFTYTVGPEVLHDINIDAQPGQIIALLGATGNGKSTILHLLPRFYDVTDGRVTIDGWDVRDVTLLSLRRNIGLVLQDVFLFNATVGENIAYGVEHATQEQIVAAAKIARIHDFIMALPDGYDTWVGERGVTLSGGQKQRIAIARTLLIDPAVLILDDATSSVDMETEYLIQQALDAVMHGRTTFVVASRLRTIKNADQILVIDDGRIVERGTHETLLAQDGLYRQVYDLQLRDQEEFEIQMLDQQMLANGNGNHHNGHHHKKNTDQLDKPSSHEEEVVR